MPYHCSVPPGGLHGGNSAATQVSGISWCGTVSSVMTLAPNPPLPPSGGLADYPLSEVEQVFKVVRIHGELEMVHSVPPSSHLILVSPSSLSPPFPSLPSPSLAFPSSGSLHSNC